MRGSNGGRWGTPARHPQPTRAAAEGLGGLPCPPRFVSSRFREMLPELLCAQLCLPFPCPALRPWFYFVIFHFVGLTRSCAFISSFLGLFCSHSSSELFNSININFTALFLCDLLFFRIYY